MKWEKGKDSDLVEDRRGRRRSSRPDRPPRRRRRGKKAIAGGAGLGLLLVFGAGVYVCSGLLGGDRPAVSVDSSTQKKTRPRRTPTRRSSSRDDTVLDDKELKQFISFLIEDVNAVWSRKFRRDLKTKYSPVRVVLFEGSTSTKCGRVSARGGPVYCPAERKMFVPPSFYRELRKELGAPGDFAQAVVIAHEIGHHAQLGMGVTRDVYEQKKRRPKRSQDLKIRQELQADCFAGIWAHSTKKRKLLEAGDVDEAITAVSAIGDDSLQRRAGRRIDPSRWSHGSSAQRVRWFKKGMRRGRLEDCDTFGAHRI